MASCFWIQMNLTDKAIVYVMCVHTLKFLKNTKIYVKVLSRNSLFLWRLNLFNIKMPFLVRDLILSFQNLVPDRNNKECIMKENWLTFLSFTWNHPQLLLETCYGSLSYDLKSKDLKYIIVFASAAIYYYCFESV